MHKDSSAVLSLIKVLSPYCILMAMTRVVASFYSAPPDTQFDVTETRFAATDRSPPSEIRKQTVLLLRAFDERQSFNSFSLFGSHCGAFQVHGMLQTGLRASASDRGARKNHIRKRLCHCNQRYTCCLTSQENMSVGSTERIILSLYI